MEREGKLVAAPKRVLLVEDDPALRKLLELTLLAWGAQVSVAADGRQALALLAQETFSILVLDLMLPEVSGYHVLDSLRKEGAHLMPVIMISARSLPEDRALAEELGVSAYLVKPFSRALFLETLNSCLEKKTSP